MKVLRAHSRLIPALFLFACADTPPPVVELTKEELHEVWTLKQSDEAAEAVAQIRSAVAEESERLGPNHWAGRYYYGDGLGVNASLYIAPEAGFAFEWHGCLGLYDRNYGPVEEVDGLITLTLTFHNQRKGFQGTHTSYRPVLWGERQHLVPPEQMIEFCTAVNHGHSGYSTLVKFSESEAEVSGVPNVPDEFRPYLLAEPIRARVAGVGETVLRPTDDDRSFFDTELTLDVGAQQGVLVGMEFALVGPDVIELRAAKVEEVFDDTCTLTVTRIDNSEKPKVGWKFWTGRRISWQPDWPTKGDAR